MTEVRGFEHVICYACGRIGKNNVEQENGAFFLVCACGNDLREVQASELPRDFLIRSESYKAEVFVVRA